MPNHYTKVWGADYLRGLICLWAGKETGWGGCGCGWGWFVNTKLWTDHVALSLNGCAGDLSDASLVGLWERLVPLSHSEGHIFRQCIGWSAWGRRSVPKSMDHSTLNSLLSLCCTHQDYINDILSWFDTDMKKIIDYLLHFCITSALNVHFSYFNNPWGLFPCSQANFFFLVRILPSVRVMREAVTVCFCKYGSLSSWKIITLMELFNPQKYLICCKR